MTIVKPAVELKLMVRADRTQYIEVWVRSAARPEIRQGIIIERDSRTRAQLPFVAGAIAENLCAKYGDNRDSCEIAHAAEKAFTELDLENPFLGDEAKLH